MGFPGNLGGGNLRLRVQAARISPRPPPPTWRLWRWRIPASKPSTGTIITNIPGRGSFMAVWSRNFPRRGPSRGLDILFDELNEFDPQVQLANGRYVDSDDFFALQARSSGNVLIAATPKISPPASSPPIPWRSATWPPKRTPMAYCAGLRLSTSFVTGIPCFRAPPPTRTSEPTCPEPNSSPEKSSCPRPGPTNLH